jgi:hypothetical protein
MAEDKGGRSPSHLKGHPIGHGSSPACAIGRAHIATVTLARAISIRRAQRHRRAGLLQIPGPAAPSGRQEGSPLAPGDVGHVGQHLLPSQGPEPQDEPLYRRHRYASLEKLYDFTRRLSSLSEGRDVMGYRAGRGAHTSISRSRRAEPASRSTSGAPGPAVFAGRGGRPSFRRRSAAFRSRPPGGRTRPVVVGTAPRRPRHCLRHEGARAERGSGSPAQSGGPGSGYLLLADRPFRHEGFEGSDLRFFETLAANAGVVVCASTRSPKTARHCAAARSPPSCAGPSSTRP